jgi:hypothetical protein
MMPAETAFKTGLRDHQTYQPMNRRYSREPFYQAAYERGYRSLVPRQIPLL